ncbi:nuclear transport factor 2 family protein [Bradyrhizobium liaoningense]|uniref:YybH family protein n=1 Tax=Bradyrhizobium liaoningense TaxID=43992 RepID=UPI001BA76779|nr:nuclear transport factor 2 family protein [Bradyrhizobium liaoningense]MBR0714853.1 nuclear transport factor 2 family protein [Bradyrhizobium liaoningense]
MTNLAPSTSFDVRAEITGAYAAWDSAFNKADSKAVAAAYVSNAKVLPPTHEVISGLDEIEKFFAGLFSGGFTDHKLTIMDAGGDEKVVYGTAKWTADGPDGSRQSVGGIATHVFERQADGSLKLRLHTFN